MRVLYILRGCPGSGKSTWVKKNQLEAYEYILAFFNNFRISEHVNFREKYCKEETAEKNRERYEYMQAEVISDPETFRKLAANWPSVRTIGVVRQTRIRIIRDKDGNDVTPDLETFRRKGSSLQPAPTTGDDKKDDTQIIGIISDLDLSAKKILEIKRGHWQLRCIITSVTGSCVKTNHLRQNPETIWHYSESSSITSYNSPKLI